VGVLGATATGNAFELKDLLAFGVGPIVARPHLTVSEQYDDNIFYQTAGSPQDDFITVINPGINLRLGKGEARSTLEATYNYSAFIYADNPYVGETSTHQVGLAAGWRGNKTQLGLIGSASWTDTIYGGYEAFILGTYGSNITLIKTNIAVPSQLRASYTLAPSANYAFSDKYSSYLNATLNETDFKQAKTLYDVNSWRTTLGMNYSFRPKIGMLSEAFYGQDAVDPNSTNLVKYPHLETVGGFLGLRGDLTRKINATLRGGYQESKQGNYSFGTPVGSVALNAQLSDRSNLTLTYSRSTSLAVSANAAYVSDNVSAQFQRTFGNRRPWTFNLGTAYAVVDYQTGDLRNLKSEYLSASASLSYAWKLWLRSSLGYQYQKTWNSGKTVDYDVNMVTLSLSIGY
jgi:hypothetical protein